MWAQKQPPQTVNFGLVNFLPDTQHAVKNKNHRNQGPIEKNWFLASESVT